MEVVIQPAGADVARFAAELVAGLVSSKPAAVLGLATGNTMVEVYSELTRRHRAEGLDFSGVTTFNLDEYVGLSPTHPCSYAAFMAANFFDRVNITRERTHLPLGTAADVPQACIDYERRIAEAGGIDLQLLGIGEDGHIAFNEPTSSLASRTRIKTLTPVTRASNRKHFPPGQEVPMHVITMGVGTIMEARHCVLLAIGQAKAGAVKAAVEGPVTAMCPASALQWHPHCTVVVDEAAASALELAEYYRFTRQHKPKWQGF